MDKRSPVFPCVFIDYAAAVAADYSRLIQDTIVCEMVKQRDVILKRYVETYPEELNEALDRWRGLLPSCVARRLKLPDSLQVADGYAPEAVARIIHAASLVNLTAPHLPLADWTNQDISRHKPLYRQLACTLLDSFLWSFAGPILSAEATVGVRYSQVLAAGFLDLHAVLDPEKDYSALGQPDEALMRRREELLASGKYEEVAAVMRQQFSNMDFFVRNLRNRVARQGDPRVEIWRLYEESGTDPEAETFFTSMDPLELAQVKRLVSDAPVLDLRWAKVQSDPACQLELMWYERLAIAKGDTDFGLMLLRAQEAVKREARAPGPRRLAEILQSLLNTPEPQQG
ncbi:MAG: hypothetical protein WC551_07265 [Patescibacteria group bacterium]